MNEFGSRIEMQRRVLRSVNSIECHEESLFGLSDKAISRWVNANGIDNGADLVSLVRELSSKLFFLANKSQEQITEDYKSLSIAVHDSLCKIEGIVANKSN